MISARDYHNIEEVIVCIASLLIAYQNARRYKQTSDVIFFMMAEQ